jgi:hypothetical protein
MPFAQLGGTGPAAGVGLGLAVSRGLTEAMRGTLDAGDTPGGGLTITVSLHAAPSPPGEPGRRELERIGSAAAPSQITMGLAARHGTLPVHRSAGNSVRGSWCEESHGHAG